MNIYLFQLMVISDIELSLNSYSVNYERQGSYSLKDFSRGMRPLAERYYAPPKILGAGHQPAVIRTIC